jgi:uncharacterized protein YhfF
MDVDDLTGMPIDADAAERMWAAYLDRLPADDPIRRRTWVAEPFGDHPELADALAALIVAGTKTATCSARWMWDQEEEPRPEPGRMTVVTDGRGQPVCIIETTRVDERRYDEIDASFAAAEGEGDRTLASWRAAHEDFFSRTLPASGLAFSPEMPLICEWFRVVHPPISAPA